MNGIHDVGGMDGLGPVQYEENEPVFHEPWEGRLTAMQTLMRSKHRLFHLDETRYAIERIDPVYYMGSSYYQIWLLRTEALLKERGVFTEEELQGKMAQLSPGISPAPHLGAFRKVKPPMSSAIRKVVLETAAGTAEPSEAIVPKFSPGMSVRAKLMSPLGHTRIPRYVRDKVGVIEAIHGLFILPDTKVHKGIDLYQTVYRVRFEAQDLWGEDASPHDKLYIELWEDYLELEGVQDEK
ncbi:nitrile hydratase subunit beta [Paenibacillus abyssi]|uniref:Nitrile hydratase subunit beta n=1 Tax=Paenibacillus abyssi TaxID=1340531 RepID=A0A917D2A1_9BACL|nr:nitrile hydratase subunit beta [Paenibacillus abyssi]GGG06557.1 nitrile hydratase [Paenibacillus abyssi]